MSRQKKSIQPHILVLRFSALGDVAMTLPVIYSVARAYPHVRFTVVTRDFFARLFINPPENVTMLGVDMKKRYHGLKGALQLCRDLAALKPTAVADLHNVFRTWLVDYYMRLRGVKVVMVNKMRSSRRKMLNAKAQQKTFIERYRDVFNELGFPADLTFKTVLTKGVNIPPIEISHPAIGIAPFARYYNKTYPPERMRRVVELLCRKGYKVYLFGGRGAEAEQLLSWDGAIHGCKSLAGQYSISEELALMSQMDLMLSMDSANQHLAALTGTKVLTIWGSTAPSCGFTPFGHDATDGICLNLDCQPCTVAGSPTCPFGHLDCMTMLSEQTIVEKIETMLNQ